MEKNDYISESVKCWAFPQLLQNTFAKMLSSHTKSSTLYFFFHALRQQNQDKNQKSKHKK